MATSKKPDILQRVANVIEQHDLATSDAPSLLMVSGGSDSTSLAYIAYELFCSGIIGKIGIVHVNHKLRDQDAEDDARFVAQLAHRLDIPLFLYEVDVAEKAAQFGENIEAVARRERYNCANEALIRLCRQTATPVSCGRIMTAHTADDRAESFYMRSIVGTGPGGFRAMRYRNGQIVRPLMDETRESLREYLSLRADEGMSVVYDDQGNLWREDATNAHTDRFRAYVRHEIMPRIKQWNEQTLTTLVRTMNLIAEEDDMLDDMATDIENSCVKWLVQDEQIGIDYTEGFILLPRFGNTQRPLQRRVVYRLFSRMLGVDMRIETASIEAVLNGFTEGKPHGGYVANIQGNLAVSANKAGVRVEPMMRFRKRRKRTNNHAPKGNE